MMIVIYLLLCIVVGFVGRQRNLGFLGYFLFSIALTPAVMLLILLITQRRFLEHEAVLASEVAACPHCIRARREATMLRYCAHCGRAL
jgi:hypothetical protein